MPHFEHTTIVNKPLDHVVAVLTTPEAGLLFAPPIIRIRLLASDDGRAADLTYERIQTTAAGVPAGHADHGRTSPIQLATTFTGRDVEGSLAYRLVSQDDATRLVQRITYEFTDRATVNLLEAATTAHNDRQFAVHLTTVRDLIETQSSVRPPQSDRAADPDPTGSTP